ncbi:MAG: ankyrin repeat domain-containing protein [Anaerolineales bacterium]|nr:ankyrin repeat domain-containing protein [Anaerolineales bacterium]
MQPQPAPDDIRSFVMAAHFDFEQVKTRLEADPSLLHVVVEEFNESALGAASHVGNRAIAEYLLSQGASLTMCAAVMLGLRDAIERFLTDDSTLANPREAHGFSALYHAAINGDVAIIELLYAHGGREGLSDALHPAISRQHAAMVEWLLAHGADPSVTNFKGKTAHEAAIDTGNEAIIATLKAHG